uniref:OTU domain-containing protein n=1 Tax=Timema poppense TaxID=170557 RepID=A0A7R9D7Q0_TIMPO|nr:unnamed protein product [Timema poppensis]
MGPRKMFPKNTEPMDQWLEGQGLYRKHIANDGSCLFRAFCEQVFLTQAVHEDVRRECLEFMEKNTSLFEMTGSGCIMTFLSQFLEEPINIHLERMKTSKDWGGLAELNALALMYKWDIVLFKEVGKPPLAITNHGFQNKVSPFFTYSAPIGAHVLETNESHQMTATVSALLYNVLYKDVFKLSDVTYAMETMLHDKSYRPSRRDSCTNNDNCVRFSPLTDYPGSDVHGRHNCDQRHCQENEYWYEQDDGNLNVKELLAQGLTPFPYKVAKALDPNIYRNIEFDVWSDIRRDIRQGFFDISNGAFQVGVKCLVNMDPERSFHAHIQEMAPNKGPVVVYVEELAEKCTVSYDILEPLPRNGQAQWQLPYKQHWYQTNRRSTIYTLSNFGKKCRYGRCHKIKEVFDPASVNPRLQYSSKTTHNIKYPSECSPRYTSNERSSQQVSQDMHNFSTIPVPVSLKQPSVTSSHFVQTTSSSGISGTTTLLMPATPPAAPSSRPPEPDSSTPSFLPPPPPQQSIMAFNESLTISSTTARTMNHPPPQIVTFTLYPDTSSSYHFVPPCMTTNLEDNKHIPKVGSNSVSCGVAGLPNVTQSSENGYSPTRVKLAPIPKDMNGNIAPNHINFTAQKSMNNDGSDLPLSDITTLRFFYNLGVDHFQLGYKMWLGDVPQPITISANCGPPCVSSASESGSYAEQYPLPDSTTCLGEDGYQPDTVVSLDQVSSNEGMQSHKEASTGWQIEPAASNMVYNVPIHGNRHYVPPRFQKEKLVESSSQQNYLKPQIVHEGNHLPTPSSDSGHGSGSANPTDLSSSGYTIPYQHPVSCTYPSMCNHPMMPCYYPVETDPNLVSMNVPYYQQYVMGPPPQPYIPQSQEVSGGKMVSQSSSQYGAPATVYPQPPTESVPESVCCPGYLSMPPQAMTYPPNLGATEGKFCGSESNAVMPQWIPVSSLAAQQGGGLMMQQYACVPPPSQTYSAPN